MFDIFNMLKKNEENKTMQVTRETIIGDILDMDQTTAPYFMEIGMHCLGCPASRNETVEQACLVHDQPVEELVEKLNAIIVANRKLNQKTGAGSAPVFLWKGEWNETMGAVAAPGRHSRTGSSGGPAG